VVLTQTMRLLDHLKSLVMLCYVMLILNTEIDACFHPTHHNSSKITMSSVRGSYAKYTFIYIIILIMQLFAMQNLAFSVVCHIGFGIASLGSYECSLYYEQVRVMVI